MRVKKKKEVMLEKVSATIDGKKKRLKEKAYNPASQMTMKYYETFYVKLSSLGIYCTAK